MTHIHYVECNRTHSSDFVIDVPIGYHWLLVMTKTAGSFWVNGSLQEYPAHSAILYRPQQKVFYKACADEFINDWVRFETTEPYITETSLPLGVPFSLNDPIFCYKLMELLTIEHNYDRDYKRSSIDYLLRILFNKLLESNIQSNLTPQYYNLLQLRNAIQNNPSEYWTVKKMAEQLMISPGYLQSMYKKAFGVTCMEDVIESRISLAKEYLCHSTASVTEIAFRCGYQNVEHFSRQFKKVTGVTPNQYRSS